MKIAYLMLCHDEYELVERITNKLIDNTGNIIVIHVDKKNDNGYLNNKFDKNPNVFFVKENIDVFWGGFNSVIATIKCMEIALQEKADRIYLLQGKDFPIHTNEYIKKFFLKNNYEYISAKNITTSHDKREYMFCYGYHYFNHDMTKKKNVIIRKFFSFLNKFGIKYRRGYFKNSNIKYDIYKGWAHFSLSHNCTKYIVDFYHNNPKFNKYFYNRFPADEIYFQTIVHNSSFKESVFYNDFCEYKNYNLTYFEYPKSVKIFVDPNEIPKDVYEHCLFVRKISSKPEVFKNFEYFFSNKDTE